MSEPIRTGSTQFIPDGARHGIALPTLRVDGVDYNIREMHRDELLTLRTSIQHDVHLINGQINADTGGDKSWLSRASFVKTLKGHQIEMVNAELSRRKRLARSVEHYFVDLARETLHVDVFRDLLSQAQEMRDHRLAEGVGHP